MMAVARREIDMVAAWSADRLGGPTDLLSSSRTYMPRGSICFSITGLDASASAAEPAVTVTGRAVPYEVSEPAVDYSS